MNRICLIGILLLCPSMASAHSTATRFAVIVGNNAGPDGSRTLRYATEDARKTHSLLIELGNFHPDNTVLLLNQTAQTVMSTLQRMETAAAQRKRQTGQNTLLLFYYSGHAEGDHLQLGKSTLPFTTLRSFLETARADVRLALLDSCHSGKLISTRSSQSATGVEINIADAISSRGYAIITSSARNELSQESSELRGAYFTHYLLSGLRGRADANGDGVITLQEAYRYVYARTLSRTVENLHSSQHPMYHFELKGRGEIVLTQTARRHARIEVPFMEPGRLLLLDGLGETILAEAELTREESVWFTVIPGDYRLYIVTPGNIVRLAEFTAPSGTTVIDADHFSTTRLERAIPKGGLFQFPEQKWSHRLGAGALVRNGPLDAMTFAVGGLLQYRVRHIRGLEPQIRAHVTRAPDVGVSTGFWDTGLSGGLGFTFPIEGLRLRTQLIGGYEHLFQSPQNGNRRHTSGVFYSGGAGVELPVGQLFFTLEGGLGGRVFRIRHKGWVHRPDVQMLVGAGWKWEQR